MAAAVSGEQRCPWDAEIEEEAAALGLEAFGDGIKLAGPRTGLTTCQLVPIPDPAGTDAACLAVWSENADQLRSPEMQLLTHRTSAALSLAFHAETGRDGLRTLATRDGLTGAWNRQAFFAQLASPALSGSCEVVCANIDDFRAVNDWHGYAAGDSLIAAVAERLRDAIRPGDVVGRVSGDEFAVLCVDVADDDVARVIAERMHQTCEEPFLIAGKQMQLSITVGAAHTTEAGSGVELFDIAERMLLELKSSAPGTWRLA